MSFKKEMKLKIEELKNKNPKVFNAIKLVSELVTLIIMALVFFYIANNYAMDGMSYIAGALMIIMFSYFRRLLTKYKGQKELTRNAGKHIPSDS